MTVLPDPEALLITALRADTSIASVTGGRVATRLGAIFPAVRVTLVGGPPHPVIQIGRPELQVECWGNGTDSAAAVQASLIARTIEAALPAIRGEYGTSWVITAYMGSGIIHSPDPDTARERYLFTVGLIVR
jgi:hypothetical protein